MTKKNEISLYGLPKGNVEQAKLKLALLKENFEYQEFFTKFMEWETKTRSKGPRIWPLFGFNRFGLVGLRLFIGHPVYKFYEILDMIDPQTDMSACSDRLIGNVLRRLFYTYAVNLVEVGEVGRPGIPIRTIEKRGLEPWERVYKIDLRKKKKQIMREMENYLDRAYFENKDNSSWNQDVKRNRDEAWKQLEVWKLRKQRKRFSEIAKTLRITRDAAKKMFYRAYEVTQDKRYDPEALKTEVWRVRKTEIGRTCDICPEKSRCTILCPAVLRYVDQDTTPLRERYLSEDSDALRDFLIQKHS